MEGINLRVPMTLTCPSCQGPLAPRIMACGSCELKLEGEFYTNEFASLDEKLLHFLRIFVHCEGRIKDMEKALGVSYPTVKANMTHLKAALQKGSPTTPCEAISDAAGQPERPDRLSILEAMAKGEMSYDEGLARLKTIKPPR